MRVFTFTDEDVQAEVCLLCLEREYDFENMSAFLRRKLAAEAKRRLKIGRYITAEDGIVILPPAPRHKPVCRCGCGNIVTTFSPGWGMCIACGERVDISPPVSRKPVPPLRKARMAEGQLALLFEEVAA